MAVEGRGWGRVTHPLNSKSVKRQPPSGWNIPRRTLSLLQMMMMAMIIMGYRHSVVAGWLASSVGAPKAAFLDAPADEGSERASDRIEWNILWPSIFATISQTTHGLS